MKRLLHLFVLLLLCPVVATAQMYNPVTWSKSVKMTDDTHGVVTLTASVENGWHVYSTDCPSGGPTAMSVHWDGTKGVKLDGKLTASKPSHAEHDSNFNMELRWWTGTVTLTQKFTATEPEFSIGGDITFMSCSDKTCTPPAHESFSLTGKAKLPKAGEQSLDEASDKAAGAAVLKEEAKASSGPVSEASSASSGALGDSTAAEEPSAAAAQMGSTWEPVASPGGTADGSGTASRSLWLLFLSSIVAGLLALLTPCVWPIIPLTVSFFLKQDKNGKSGVGKAVLYGLSIIIIYVLLGLLVTAVFGASGLNAMATGAVWNIIFFVMLVVFGISFLGGFDLSLPSSWSSKLDSRAGSTTGLLSIFFMAFTLVLVSFSCTGPIIGTLLVEAAGQNSLMAPAVGMLGFSLALAVPFTLFALFPSWMKKMPRSGQWMGTVKVVLGFIELIFSLKFLSVADMAYGWHILDREVFLAIWIVLFGCLGIYLLGFLRFKGEAENGGIGVTRFLLAVATLAFTVYLIPGLWGAPLKATSAFVPPLSTQDFNLYEHDNGLLDDYDKAIEASRQSGKPLFIDFSGYGCVNCRKMEGAVLSNDEVKQKLNDFVNLRLMVDDKTPLDAPITVKEHGKEVTLSTVGDKWCYLQRHKFHANSQPFYVVLDGEGKLLSGPRAYDEDVDKFMEFLNAGTKND